MKIHPEIGLNINGPIGPSSKASLLGSVDLEVVAYVPLIKDDSLRDLAIGNEEGFADLLAAIPSGRARRSILNSLSHGPLTLANFHVSGIDKHEREDYKMRRAAYGYKTVPYTKASDLTPAQREKRNAASCREFSATLQTSAGRVVRRSYFLKHYHKVVAPGELNAKEKQRVHCARAQQADPVGIETNRLRANANYNLKRKLKGDARAAQGLTRGPSQKDRYIPVSKQTAAQRAKALADKAIINADRRARNAKRSQKNKRTQTPKPQPIPSSRLAADAGWAAIQAALLQAQQ